MIDRYGQELAQVGAAFAQEKTLRLLLESPTFDMRKKTAILEDLSSALDLSAGMRKFLGLLLVKDRLKYLNLIEGDFRGLADDLSGVLRATVTGAAELNAEQQQEIRAGLEKNTGKKVELELVIDPALIGGIKVAIGGKVYDGSLKTQLNRIEDTLKKG